MDLNRVRLHVFCVAVCNGEEHVKDIWQYVNKKGMPGILNDAESGELQNPPHVYHSIDYPEFVRALGLVGLGDFAPKTFGRFSRKEFDELYEELQRVYMLVPEEMTPVRILYYGSLSAGEEWKNLIAELVRLFDKETNQSYEAFLDELQNNLTWP